jgi:hypothetical protein
MSITFTVTAAGLMALGLKTAIDAGGAAGYVKFYDGSRPSPGGTPTGALVVTCPLAYPCGSVDGSGNLIFTAGTEGLVGVTSTPTWARIFRSDDTRVADCSCRLSSDPDTGEEIVLDAPSVYAGAYIKIAGGGIGFPQ